jgi:hypothetical protein
MRLQVLKCAKIVYFLFTCLFSQLLWAYNPIPGTIPLEYGGYPATDLFYKGRVLLPHEAHELYLKENKNTRGAFTLSDLNPEEQLLWNDKLSLPLDETFDEIPVDDKLDEVDFISYSLTRSDNYRFTVSKNFANYLIYLGPKVHNFLLRKNLLRKLGYEVPSVKYIKNIKINFQSKSHKDDFILDFQATIGRDTDRWITSNPEEENSIYLQDLIIMEDQNYLVNLSVGFIPESMFEGKRIFQSLIVPFSLTDIPESINMLDWTAGRIISENVHLPYEYATDFNCSNDDAKWIVKRILNLRESDWIEIVDKTHMPEVVKMLLLEKMKARRNNLGVLFGIDNKALPVDSLKSDESGKLVEGKLTQEFFPGYGRRFKITDPDSPLSFSEMSSLFKSKLVSQGIDLLVSSFNSMKFMGTDTDEKLKVINDEVSVKLNDAITKGESVSTAIGTFIFPTVQGRLILGRDIVAGSYLGTDNLIQLVDSFGISLSAGVFGGVSGVVAKTGKALIQGGRQYSPISLNASAQAYFTRTYSHVKPITSIKKAMKYPYQNLIIPYLKQKQASAFKELENKDYDAINLMEQKLRDEEFTKIYELITKNLEIGESLIITDSLGAGLSGEAGMNLYNVVNAKLKVAPNEMVMSRLHILRRNENTIQIYKDFGNVHSIEVSLSLEKFVPILKAQVGYTLGSAKTKFTNFNISKNNIDFKERMSALRSLFRINSTDLLNKIKKPFTVRHKFQENKSQLGVFVLRYNHINSSDVIEVEAPNGETKKLLRRYKGHTLGLDYENYAQDLISLITSKIAKTQFAGMTFSGNNSGYTFMGKAINKINIYEAVNENGKYVRPYTRLTRIWNGWRIKTEKAKKILEEIKERYGMNFFSDYVLGQTKKLFLYNINVNFFVHSKGIDEMLMRPEEEVKNIFENYQSRDTTNFTGNDKLLFSGYKKFLRLRERYFKKEDKERRASNILTKLVNIVEEKLNIEGIEKMFGSRDNFLVLARIDGFRIGDENGDVPIISNTFGKFGNDSLYGPSSEILEFMKRHEGESMSEGEFYINWLLGRII